MVVNYLFIFQGYDQDDWDSDFDDDTNGHTGMSAPTGNTGQPQHSLPVPIRSGPGHGSTGDVSSIGKSNFQFKISPLDSDHLKVS